MVDSIIDQESEEGSVKVSISKGVFNSPSLDMFLRKKMITKLYQN